VDLIGEDAEGVCEDGGEVLEGLCLGLGRHGCVMELISMRDGTMFWFRNSTQLLDCVFRLDYLVCNAKTFRPILASMYASQSHPDSVFLLSFASVLSCVTLFLPTIGGSATISNHSFHLCSTNSS
jgi:hypothetical protein